MSFDYEDKFDMNFKLRAFGRSYTLAAEYDDTVSWTEILDDIIKQLEAAYGYSFDVQRTNKEDEPLGIYYKGKDDGSE